MRKRVFDFLRRASKLFYLNSSNEDLEMTKVIVRFVSIFNVFQIAVVFMLVKRVLSAQTRGMEHTLDSLLRATRKLFQRKE